MSHKQNLISSLERNEKMRKLVIFLIYFSAAFVVLDIFIEQYVWALLMIGVTFLNMHTLKAREEISANYRDMIRRREQDDNG